MVQTANSDVLEPRFPLITRAFADCSAAGIIALAGGKASADWPLPWSYWRDFGARYLLQLCQTQTISEQHDPIPPLDSATLATLHLSIPPMPGAEYSSPEVLAKIWNDLDAWVLAEITRNAEGLAGFLHHYAPLWRQVGRVCFHLAENRQDPDFPFAFMATYIPSLGRNARARHLPLSQALREYAGANNRQALLRLLEPVNAASHRCPWVQELLESSDLYHPLAWSPEEAYPLLKDAPCLKRADCLSVCPIGGRNAHVPRCRLLSAPRSTTVFQQRRCSTFRCSCPWMASH